MIAATDICGRVTTCSLKKFSINVDDFIEFLGKLRQGTGKHFIYVFLDNLRVHHSNRVKEYCGINKIKLVFNAAYSSEFNPVERLWALSKQLFRKLLITNDYPDD